MSLRLRLFLGLASLVAVLVAAQWWWVRGLTRDLSDEVGFVALKVGHALTSIFTHVGPECPADATCEGQARERQVKVVAIGSKDGAVKEVAPLPDVTIDYQTAPSAPEKRRTIHWVGLKEGAEPPRWIQVGGDEAGSEGHQERYEVEQKIVLRLDTAAESSGESAGEPRYAGAGNRWFNFLTDAEPPPAGILTVTDADESTLRHIPIPNAGLNQKLERFRQRMLWGSFAVFAVGLLLSAVVAHRVTAPLERLAKAAREVGGGALGAQVPVTAPGEVGEAIRAFNRMSSELESLDRKTRELRAREHLGEIGEIARGLAHTLRNPLNALGLSVEELASRADGEAAELAGAARRQIRRIDHSIRSFLALASQNGGAASDVAPAELAQDVALEVLQDSRGKVRLEVDAEAGSPALRAVEPELRAVLQALLVNAVEASPEGGTVWIRVLPGDAGRVRIEIEDEGPGLAEKVRRRLFTPHLTTKATGSGMGLFLAHRIATTRYGGRLELEDRPAGGTRAVLELGARNQELAHG
jgi:signal transduction histidine kinase